MYGQGSHGSLKVLKFEKLKLSPQKSLKILPRSLKSLNYVCAIIFGKMLWSIITFVLNFWRATVPRQSFRLKLGVPNQVAKSLKRADTVLKSPFKKIKSEKGGNPDGLIATKKKKQYFLTPDV